MHFLFLLFFTLIPDVKSDPYTSNECAMELTYVVTHLDNEQKVRIELTVKGGVEPYHYIFFDERNNPISWDFTKPHCLIEKDKYPKYAKVRDAEGCIKIIEFNESDR